MTQSRRGNNLTPHISRPHFAVFKPRFQTLLSRYLYIYAGTRGRGVFRIGAKVPKGALVNICDIWPDLCTLIPKWKPEIEVISELPKQIFTVTLNKLCAEEGGCRTLTCTSMAWIPKPGRLASTQAGNAVNTLPSPSFASKVALS